MRGIIALFLVVLPLSFLAQKVSGSFSIGGEYTKGNYNAASLDSRLELKDDTGKYVWNFMPTFRIGYLITTKQLLTREAYLSSALERKIKNFKIISFTESEHSYNRKILYRGSIGLGCGYRFTVGKVNLDFTEAALPDFICLEDKQRLSLRLSSRLKLIYKIEKFTFTSYTLVQPAIYSSMHIRSRDNFSLRSTNLAETVIFKKFSMALGYDITVQTYPAYVDSKIKPCDYRAYFLIKYVFR
jgi:hypothetical protein